MYELKHKFELCAKCKTVDCLMKCQYMTFSGVSEAHEEMMRLIEGKDTRILKECQTCYACEEYCRYGNHPFYLIGERREEKEIYTAPRPITKQWINMTQMQGKYMVGEIKEKVLSLCYIPILGSLAQGELFDGLTSSIVFGAEFMCPAVHTHFARMSVVKERLPLVIENFVKLGVKEVICLHDECYGTFTAIAPAYGIEVPFTPVYYMDFLLQRLKAMTEKIKPLNIKAAYQRPCSNRLIPEKQERVKEICDLIGVQIVSRKYEGENALCCGEIIRSISGYRLADEIQEKNLMDMVEGGAEYCVFNCPACLMTLSEKAAKKNLKPVHIIDLCRAAIGERGIH